MLDTATQARYRDLATWMARRAGAQRCPVIGINGAQGSGKSTVAAFIAAELADRYRLKAAVLALDDLYLPRAARQELAATVHPLLATRGVPGSHEVPLGICSLRAMRDLAAGESLALPRFSKADDERLPRSQWQRIDGPVDLILFEGWCVGLPPQSADELIEPINSLEAQEDSAGVWRGSVNAALAGTYANWFALLDALVFLQVPDFGSVRRWRGQQELETARLAGVSAAGLQSPVQLERFIQHYERLTRHALRVLPARADVLLTLGEDHAVRRMDIRGA